MSARAIVVREARRNLARNTGAAISVVVASALGASLVAISAEWFVLVGQARAATAGSRAALSVATQLGGRLPLLAGAIVAAEVIVLSTTTLAMRQRRLGEARFFELTLGAPASYTRNPALVEGLGQGLVGGMFATVVALGAAPGLVRVERSTVAVFGSDSSVRRIGHVLRTTTHTIDVHNIQLAAGDLVVIAVVVIGLGAVLGFLNTFVTQWRPRRHLGGGQAY
jgi:hypothetical protein